MVGAIRPVQRTVEDTLLKYFTQMSLYRQSVLFSGGVISYAMPQGDKRGATYEFYDWNYDGEWSGDSLRNGLGSLTDGNLGPADYKLSYYAKSKRCYIHIKSF